MTDLFGLAAARAQQKRAAEKRAGEPITMENNALVRVMREREAEEREKQERAAQWEKQIREAFDGVIELANSVGRRVKDITWNGDVAWVVREEEAVRIYTGKIRDMRDLQRAVARLMNGAMGC